MEAEIALFEMDPQGDLAVSGDIIPILSPNRIQKDQNRYGVPGIDSWLSTAKRYCLLRYEIENTGFFKWDDLQRGHRPGRV
jgi:hypothetical protein